MLIAEHSSTIESCRFCFMCRHVCTAGVVSGRESDTPRGRGLILFKVGRGYADYSPDVVETLYRCCLCGVCQAWCKAGCKPPDAVLAARADVVAQGRQPRSVQLLRDHLLATGNPFGLAADASFNAQVGAELLRPRAEVLFYVGADAAYQQPEIAAATVRVLQLAGVDLCLLADEPSTGKPLDLLGYRAEARQCAAALAARIRGTQCRTLLTGCPSSFDALVRDFPAAGASLDGIEILHTTQYLARLLDEGRLSPKRSPLTSATYLDGTYLARGHGMLEPPRRILGRLPGLELREMHWRGQFAHAAGESGGIFRLLQPQLSRQMAARVLAEAAATRAAALVTSCPATKTALTEAGAASPPVLDIAELLSQAF